jgi:hypothetical protein
LEFGRCGASRNFGFIASEQCQKKNLSIGIWCKTFTEMPSLMTAIVGKPFRWLIFSDVFFGSILTMKSGTKWPTVMQSLEVTYGWNHSNWTQPLTDFHRNNRKQPQNGRSLLKRNIKHQLINDF